MATQSEAALEQGLIRTLQNMSYEFVQIDEETNLHNNFKRQLEIHNQKALGQVSRTELTDKEFERVMIHLAGGTRFEKAKKLRNLFALDLDDGQRVWLEFLNTQKWCQNEFQVSNQITVEGRRKCRYDVTILINGLPLVQIELKRRGVELKEAYNQIQRYHKTSFHGLFDYIQIFVISTVLTPATLPTIPIKATNSLSIGRTLKTIRSTTSDCLPQSFSTNALSANS